MVANVKKKFSFFAQIILDLLKATKRRAPGAISAGFSMVRTVMDQTAGQRL